MILNGVQHYFSHQGVPPHFWWLVGLEAGLNVVKLSNGKLRVESASDSIEWVLGLMREHNLPPAEIVSNPDALHELFIKSISANHGQQP